MQGTIKKLVTDKGFGFISGADHGDVFFHHSVVADHGFEDLQIGQTVEYEIESDGGKNKGGKGPRAASVRPA
jgi:CspA family cold shock protein